MENNAGFLVPNNGALLNESWYRVLKFWHIELPVSPFFDLAWLHNSFQSGVDFLFMSLINKNIKPLLAKFLLIIFLLTASFYSTSQEKDTIDPNNHIIGLDVNVYRVPYFLENGSAIESFKINLGPNFSYRLNPYFLIKLGLNYQFTDTIYSKNQHSFLFDFIGVAYLRRYHLDLGLHVGNYSFRRPPFSNLNPLAQYVSLGYGITWPLGDKFTLEFIGRQYFNVTLSKNDFLSYPDFFIGVTYSLKGSSKYYKKKKNNQ